MALVYRNGEWVEENESLDAEDQPETAGGTGTLVEEEAPESAIESPAVAPAPSQPVQTMTSAPTVAPPPPPPPRLEDFAADWMRTPNRYLSPLVQATRQAGEARLEESEASGKRAIDEYAAQRGLIGSSLEENRQIQLQRALQADRLQQERDIMEMLANAEALDRAAAGGYGLDVERFRESQRVSQQEINLRAQELQQQAELEGRSLDLQEARDQAQQELERERIAAGERMQGRELSQRENEFARQFGLNEREFAASQDQFSLRFGEEVASRLQDDAQFRAVLGQRDVQFAVDSGLRNRALDLQEQGMDAEEAFRQAGLEQEGQLRNRALDLQEQGLDADRAYRWAALEQDGRFREETLRLQDRGLSLEDAYRYAELNFQDRELAQRQSQFQDELNLRLRQADTEDERFDAMMELWKKYFGDTDTSPPGDETTSPPGDRTAQPKTQKYSWEGEDSPVGIVDTRLLQYYPDLAAQGYIGFAGGGFININEIEDPVERGHLETWLREQQQRAEE